MDIICPDCPGLRYSEKAGKIRYRPKRFKNSKLPGDDKIHTDGVWLPDIMGMTVTQTLKWMDIKRVGDHLEILQNLGLGYLMLGEDGYRNGCMRSATARPIGIGEDCWPGKT